MGVYCKEDYSTFANNLNVLIVDNLNKLMEARGYSVQSLVKKMREKPVCSRQYLGQMLNKDNSNNRALSAAMLLMCCDFFGVTVENLVSTDFNPNERIEKDNDLHREYLDIEKILEREKNKIAESGMEKRKKEFEKGSEKVLGKDNQLIVTDPNNGHFQGYLQSYFCYYYPTSSNENKGNNIIIPGILTLSKEGAYCKATLEIDSRGMDAESFVCDKKYTGFATISTTVQSVQCVMLSERGDYCFMIFRQFAFLTNHRSQCCRIAEVLSSSSGSENRLPVTLRMLLSKEKIKKSDIGLISPSLTQNYGEIAVGAEELDKLSNENEKYRNIIDKLFGEKKSKEMYFIHESKSALLSVARETLGSDKEALEFLMKIRALSYAFRYNKVGESADKNIVRLLQSRGYYSQDMNEK